MQAKLTAEQTENAKSFASQPGVAAAPNCPPFWPATALQLANPRPGSARYAGYQSLGSRPWHNSALQRPAPNAIPLWPRPRPAGSTQLAHFVRHKDDFKRAARQRFACLVEGSSCIAFLLFLLLLSLFTFNSTLCLLLLLLCF